MICVLLMMHCSLLFTGDSLTVWDEPAGEWVVVMVRTTNLL